MRKLVACVLTVVSLSFGVPSGVMAQSVASVQAGSISGEAVDAGGRGVPTQPVELIQAGQVIQTTVTGARGTFTFANVASGDYVVRVLVNGQPAGVRVSVTSGVAARAMVVLPSAAAPSAALLALGPIFWTGLATFAAIGTGVAIVKKTGS